MTRRVALCLALAPCVLVWDGARLALAQDLPPEVEIEPVVESPEATAGIPPIDLQNLVTTVTKGTTTVQEAPAIVTVITADDIRRWGYRDVMEVLGTVPGWYRSDVQGEIYRQMIARGAGGSMLLLYNGISLFEPFSRIAVMDRARPLESIKRVEVVTGPGGVLWGAQSLLGIVNLITKDADDVRGLEAGAGYGDGRGERSLVKTYALVGHSLAGGRLKLFGHASYTSYLGQELTSRQFLLGPLPPQPLGSVRYGGIVTGEVPRSWILNLDGKISSGPLSLYWEWADGERHHPATIPLGIVEGPTPDGTPWGPNARNDPRGVGRDLVLNRLDRIALAEYRDRFAGAKAGLVVKGFLTQFLNRFQPIIFTPPSATVPGGVVARTDPTTWRAGATMDADFALTESHHVLFGGDAFREWTDGSTLYFVNPDPSLPPGASRFPFLCPHDDGGTYQPQCPVPFLFPVSREVAAGFLADQWRILPTLLLDAGARVQAGFGQRPYDPLAQFAGTLVWSFLPGWHLKANFSQGFRPPGFNVTDSNGAGAQYAGARNIKNELSNAWQGEINARVLRGVRRVRELTLRADYSYTLLDNIIVINNGRYSNAGQRGVSSAEFLSQLYLRGDHILQLSYTFLDIVDSEKGRMRVFPNHWATLQGTFNLVRRRLDLVTSLSVASAIEDPNRVPQSNLSSCQPGLPVLPENCGADALASQIAIDRLPATALWNLGLRVTGLFQQMDLEMWAYNLLDQHWYQVDTFYDLAPATESQPKPGPGFSFFGNARLRF